MKGKRVLVRVDFNVPLEERNGKQVVTDDTRIRETLPTITYLREQGAKVILMSHLGRPKGKPVEKYSLRPVAAQLEELIGHPVAFASDCVGKPAEEIAANLRDGGVGSALRLRLCQVALAPQQLALRGWRVWHGPPKRGLGKIELLDRRGVVVLLAGLRYEGCA